MKYKIKYLIEKDVSADNHCYYYLFYKILTKCELIYYYVDKCELINDCFEVEVGWVEIYLRNLMSDLKYCINVIYDNKEYFGLSEKDMGRFRKKYPNYYAIRFEENRIKSVKEVMIENILK